MSAAYIITIPVSAGELIDRITILDIKAARFRDPTQAARVRQELVELFSIRDAILPASPALTDLTGQLKAVNEELWHLEDALRVCERQQRFCTEFVELARSVYRHNDRRSALKQQINKVLGSDFGEEKQYS